MEYGVEHGWVSEGVCTTHDLLPVTDGEAADLEEGLDPCIPAIRVWTERI
jgi:hypothetical protein